MKSSRFLDDRQFTLLLRTIRDRKRKTSDRDHFLFYFLGRTGLRVSEALSLRARDFWLGDPSFVRVKTLKRKRPVTDEVLLDPTVARACREWLKTKTDDDFAFPGHAPTYLGPHPLTRQAVGSLFRFYAKRAALPPGLVVHSLRHYRGTVLAETTGDLEFTREQMRHRDLETTKQYLHISGERRARYLKELEHGKD